MGRKITRACAALAACICAASAAAAQTGLAPGDLAFTGYDSTETDQFSFTLLRDVEAGTTLTFTDRGWLASGGFRAGEDTFTVVFDAGHPCGAEFVAVMSPLEVLDSTGAPVGVTEGSGLRLSMTGDQIFAFQGEAPTDPGGVGLLAALQMNGPWDADATSTNTSAFPTGLVGGLHAPAITPETNNARYDCALTSDTPAVLLAAVHEPAGWLRDDAVPFDLLQTCGFTCSGACVAPEVPVVEGVTSISSGGATTLSIASGSLGDATGWQWYVEGCGATSVGTGPEIVVAPGSTTEFFVRAEGGCVAPGPCAGVTVTVEAPAAVPGKEQQKCLNTMLGQMVAVHAVQGNEIAKCATGYARGKRDSAADCVDADADGRIARARGKAHDLAAKKCAAPPAFAWVGPAAVVDAAVDASTGLVRDLLGPDLDSILVPDREARAAARCQRAITQAARQCLDARLKAVGRCVKAGLKAGRGLGLEDVAACLDVDPGGRVAAACDRVDGKVDGLRRSIDKLCVAADLAPSTVLPGCPLATDVETTHACVAGGSACRACRAVSSATGLGDFCETFDDGLDNGSCPT